ncbi:MAG: EMC3/TMCO1 family protein [Nanoarchaeota archaeon]
MFLDPIFDPLLRLEPVWALLIFSSFLSGLITLLYVLFTNQKKMHELKDEMKGFQKQMRAEQKNPKKVMELQKKAMEKNMEYFRMSLKSTLITFIPIIFIFSWMGANMEYHPVRPDELFSTTAMMQKGVDGEVVLKAPEGFTLLDNATKTVVDGAVRWELKGPEGEYELEYTYKDETQTKTVLITVGDKYSPAKELVKSKRFKELRIDMERVHPFGDLKVLGWQPGWLGTYIIFSLITSMGLRKIFNIA